jgi:hypothetical protein
MLQPPPPQGWDLPHTEGRRGDNITLCVTELHILFLYPRFIHKTLCNASPVTCHLSPVTGHPSPVLGLVPHMVAYGQGCCYIQNIGISNIEWYLWPVGIKCSYIQKVERVCLWHERENKHNFSNIPSECSDYIPGQSRPVVHHTLAS